MITITLAITTANTIVMLNAKSITKEARTLWYTYQNLPLVE